MGSFPAGDWYGNCKTVSSSVHITSKWTWFAQTKTMLMCQNGEISIPDGPLGQYIINEGKNVYKNIELI